MIVSFSLLAYRYKLAWPFCCDLCFSVAQLLIGISKLSQVREPFGQMLVTVVHHFPPVQGVEGVPVTYGPAHPLHDQLPCSAFAQCHIACSALVPGGLDLICLSEPRFPSWTHRRGRNARGSAVQYVHSRPLGLHDGCWWVLKYSSLKLMIIFSGLEQVLYSLIGCTRHFHWAPPTSPLKKSNLLFVPLVLPQFSAALLQLQL